MTKELVMLITEDCLGTHQRGFVERTEYTVLFDKAKSNHERFHEIDGTPMCDFRIASEEAHQVLLNLVSGTGGSSGVS